MDIRSLIGDRDSKHPRAFDAVCEAEGIEIITTGIRVPPMKPIEEVVERRFNRLRQRRATVPRYDRTAEPSRAP
ncbi:hypothetical protein ABZ746_15940 [Streptomyces sp. NPDC020096]